MQVPYLSGVLKGSWLESDRCTTRSQKMVLVCDFPELTIREHIEKCDRPCPTNN